VKCCKPIPPRITRQTAASGRLGGEDIQHFHEIGTMLKIVPHNQTYVATASSDVWCTTSVIPHWV
jgi:hypothetical protein